MKKIVIIIVALLTAVNASAQVPKNGDIGAKIVTNFTERSEAMYFVVKDILFQLDLVPDVYNYELGYIVTERFLYETSDRDYMCYCQFVFMFKETSEGVVVKLTGRDYGISLGMHNGPLEYKKGGKEEEAYWKYLTDMAKKIPHKSLSYYGK